MKKLNKNILLGLGSTAAIVAPVATVVSCSLFDNGNGSDLEFMNYVDYIGDTARSQIESTYTYTEFGDLPELKTAIAEKRIAGGIGSDYYNAFLAGMGAIEKIDFARLYKMPELANSATLGAKLKDIYSEQAWKIMESFDKDFVLRIVDDKVKTNIGKPATWDQNGNRVLVSDITKASHDLDNDGEDDHLYEYMAPYFTQNKIVGLNIHRLYDNANATGKALLDSKGGRDIPQADFEALVDSEIAKLSTASEGKSYENIFKVLQNSFGANSIIVNNYMRDNMMIGSDVINKGAKIEAPTQANYENQINEFFKLANTFSQVHWSDSGVGTLDHLVNSNVGSDTVGILYNGDALYAYNGGSDADHSESGAIRIINPKNSTFLEDGLVIPSYMSQQENFSERTRMYDIIGGALYDGLSNQYSSTTQNTSFKRLNNVFGNFDTVNYTPAFQSLYNYVMDGTNYFDNDDSKAIMKSTEDSAKQQSTGLNVTGIIDESFEQNVLIKYNSKF